MTYPLRWTDIGSDVNWIDYGGMWAAPRCEGHYFVIRFQNLEDLTGEDGAGYHVDLFDVDLNSERLPEALKSLGQPHDNSDFAKAYALASYGASAPLHSAAGHNAHKLVRAAKKLARELREDPEAFEALMDRPVNALGSTAREYQQGDIRSAVIRGVAKGDPNAELMLKLGMSK